MKHTCVDTLPFKALSATKLLHELFVFCVSVFLNSLTRIEVSFRRTVTFCFYIELFVIENRSGN
jgi:hypothetical protein